MPIDSFIKNQAISNAEGKKVKVKKPAVLLFPFSAERIYRRQLLEFQKIYAEQVNLIIIPQIDSLVRNNDLTRPDSSDIRLDFTDQVNALILSLTFSYKQLVTDNIMNRIATDQAFRISNFNDQQFKKVVNSSLGVNPFISEPYFSEQIKSFVDQNVNLITNITDQQTRRISDTLLRDLSAGLGSAEIKGDLAKIGNFGINRSKLIARDQTAKFNSTLSELRMQSVGIEEYNWLTVGDERVRPTHRANNGKTFRNDTPPPVTGHPGHDVNCRCTRQAVITDELFDS